MTEKIELYWIKKFREICSDTELSDTDIIGQFHFFCKQEEDAINDRWINRAPIQAEKVEEEKIDDVEEIDFEDKQSERDNFPTKKVE